MLTLPQPLSSPPVLSGVHVTRFLVLCVCFVDRCLSFFFWSLCCLFFNIQILITPLVSSNSSYKNPTSKFISETCLVQTLSTSDQRYLFGYTPDGATGKIFSAGKMLHMVEPGAMQVYMGVKSYRGIAVDTWQSCQYWDAYDATMNVTWYFTGMMIYKCYNLC